MPRASGYQLFMSKERGSTDGTTQVDKTAALGGKWNDHTDAKQDEYNRENHGLCEQFAKYCQKNTVFFEQLGKPEFFVFAEKTRTKNLKKENKYENPKYFKKLLTIGTNPFYTIKEKLEGKNMKNVQINPNPSERIAKFNRYFGRVQGSMVRVCMKYRGVFRLSYVSLDDQVIEQDGGAKLKCKHAFTEHYDHPLLQESVCLFTLHAPHRTLCTLARARTSHANRKTKIKETLERKPLVL